MNCRSVLGSNAFFMLTPAVSLRSCQSNEKMQFCGLTVRAHFHLSSEKISPVVILFQSPFILPTTFNKDNTKKPTKKHK